jgi:hypothetical protein
MTKVIACITDFAAVDRIIDYLRLIYVVERPPPPRLAYQELLVVDSSRVVTYAPS